jgi:hypothetical protein
MLSFKQFIAEMPQNIGDSTATIADDKMNAIVYSTRSQHTPIGKIEDYSVHHNKKGKESQFSVLDHPNKRAGFTTTVERRPKNKNVPFSHNTQTYVGRDPKTDLGRGFGSNFVYDRLVINTEVPLVSDQQQYTGGHKMWHSLIDKAHKEGHHAYLSDNGKLSRITPENKAEVMASSYGKDEEFKNKRYVISKTPLTQD